jgi:hypothetical protein
VDKYPTAAVLSERIEPTADASLAAMRDRRRLGIAMAAMIRMIATTINSSMSEKPLCFLVPILSEMGTVTLLHVESRSRHNFWHFVYWLLPDYKRLTYIFLNI